MIERKQSSMGAAMGLIVAIVAVVGTQLLGWEWGSGQLVPTIIGVIAAIVGILVIVRRTGFLD